MKAVVDTPDRLVLDDVPWLTGLAMVAVILVAGGIGLFQLADGRAGGLVTLLIGGGIGGAGFLAFVRRIRLDLDRADGTVRLIRRTAFGTKRWDLPLLGVDRAAVEEKRGSRGGRIRRAVLRLHDGSVQEIDPVFTSGRGPQRAVAAINAWLGVAD